MADDPAALTAIRDALVDAARHRPEWPGELLSSAPPDESLLIELWRATPAPRRRAFVAAVDAAGSAHLAALIAGARKLALTARDQSRPLMMLLSPYLSTPTSTEIAVEEMLGHLRDNNRQGGEVAERVLRRHDMLRPRDDDHDD